MKFLIVLALACVGAFAAPAADQSVVEDITKAINDFKNAISDPLLDLHDEKLSLDLGFETLDFTFENVVLSGIKNLEISTLTFDDDTGNLVYELTVPEIKANVEFDLILAGLLDAVNHPVVDVALSNLKLAGTAVLDASSSPNKLSDFNLLITLEGAQVDLTGILNDDALTEKLEAILNEQLPTIVNDINVQLEPVVSPFLKSVINIILSLTT